MGVEVGIHISEGGSWRGDVEEVEGEMVVGADMVGVQGSEVLKCVVRDVCG